MKFFLLAFGLLPSLLLAQRNPVPFITLPITPTSVPPGSPGFTLTVNGVGFMSSSVVNWNGAPRATRFVSATQLTAMTLASDVAVPTSAAISIVNPAPGGGRSNTALLEVTIPRATTSFNQTSLTPKAQAYFVGIADLNKDSNLDLVVPDSAGAVEVILGNGDGTFAPPVSYPVGKTPVSVAIADLNGDGNPDLVVSDLSSEQISVLLGKGDGTFQAAVNYKMDGEPQSIGLADFNGDGKLDVVAANYNGGYIVSIMLGNGDGTFQPPVSYGSGLFNIDVTIGDFNGDGKLDVAVTQFSTAASGVNILLGNGDGTFQNPRLFTTDAGAESVAVVDFNGDGKLDLAVACEYANDVNILIGKGDGTFKAPVAYVTGPLPYSIAVGDLNGDGITDLVVTNGGTNSISLLQGNSDGTFQPHRDYTTASIYPFSLALADLNRDGLPDLVAAGVSGPISVLLQTTVVLAPSSIAFGEQNVGTSSAAHPITVTNTAATALNISNIAITGGNPDDFSQTNNCPTAIAPGASCTINVTFTPQAIGTRTATVTITDGAPNSPQTAALTGGGIQSQVTLAPATLTFPTQLISTISPAMTVTLTNSGNATLNITSINVTGNFQQTNTCGTSLAPLAACTISVTFQPLTKGPLNGILSVTDDAPASPQQVPVTGTGTFVKLQPARVDLGSEPVGTPSPARNIQLTNMGSTSLGIASFSVAGANAGDFSQKNNCPANLAAGANCIIAVTFTPTAQGTRMANVSISDNGGGSPQKVSLTGTGT